MTIPQHARFGLSNESVERLQAHLDRRAGRQEPAPAPEAETLRRFASMQEAETTLLSEGYESVGSMFYRKAHQLWHLAKSSDGTAIIRVASEPEVFEEDEVVEAPGPDNEVRKSLMACVDRFGVPVVVGASVDYSLGGEPVSGRVVRASHGYLDVQLADQLDSGVPSELVLVRQAAAEGTFEHEVAKADNDAMDLHINPDQPAKPLTPKPRVASEDVVAMAQHFGSYGAILADEFVGGKCLPKATLEVMQKLAKDKVALQPEGGRIASWESLTQLVDSRRTAAVRELIAAGIKARRYGREHNLPFALAFELRHELEAIPPKSARLLLLGARDVQVLDASDNAFRKLVEEFGYNDSKRIASYVLAYRGNALRMQRKTAVDQSAKDYWKAYFGEYGDQWVKEVKRRVKADLVTAVLRKQGLDEEAAKYWGDYFGEYGDRLIEEVDRAVGTRKPENGPKKDDKTAALAQPHSPDPMPLPAPVARRDIFAGRALLADEGWHNNRVALAKGESDGFDVLIRVGEAQRQKHASTQKEAIEWFRQAVRQHCGV